MSIPRPDVRHRRITAWFSPAQADAMVAIDERFDALKPCDDFRGLLADSERAAAELHDTLRNSRDDAIELETALKQTTQSCIACHKAYRNERK